MNAMSSSIPLTEALNYLDTFCEFIINNDIPAAINGNANYLAALGLSVYTEIMGGLYCGNLKAGELGKRYISFIQKFFPPEYMKVEANLKKDGLPGLYIIVRSGLTHEYFIKKVSKIEMDTPPGQALAALSIIRNLIRKLYFMLNNTLRTLRMHLNNIMAN